MYHKIRFQFLHIKYTLSAIDIRCTFVSNCLFTVRSLIHVYKNNFTTRYLHFNTV